VYVREAQDMVELEVPTQIPSAPSVVSQALPGRIKDEADMVVQLSLEPVRHCSMQGMSDLRPPQY
jgi:hypothetical protein